MLAVILALTAPALAADPLVDVRTVAPGVVLDVRYATPRNFLGRAVYPEAAAFLRLSTARKLARAERALSARGRRLVIYDAYRPLSVQRLLWAAKPDRRFVADPARGGSVHNRGGAVDVGLAGADGRPLAMPTGFDEFSPRAAHGAKGVPPKAAANAAELEAAMLAAGFKPLPEEWWHYEDPAARGWPPLDVPFDELVK
ncbi:MAG TPA: M15 family metallopeptidase [Elusimicrobiota bacterium]|nr:M15 family metallopeptidase [Elusimicrobiota bacterium]